MEARSNVTLRALRDLALLAGASLVAASLWATGLPKDEPYMLDAQAWQDRAHRLAQDPALRRRLAAAARLKAGQVSWDAVINRFEGLIRRVADRQPIASSFHTAVSAA